MPLHFHYRTEQQQYPNGISVDEQAPARVALFPGAYNPPTVAHEAIALAALGWADEVVWVIPHEFPHKPFEHTGLEQRLEMLRILAEPQLGFSIATSDGGLYAEIGDEAREFYGPLAEIALVCGKDAAHRIANWDYGDPHFFARMLGAYRLLVAARHGDFDAGAYQGDRVLPLDMPANFDHVSSSLVRERILHGEEWHSLVPAGLVGVIEELYCQPPPSAR